MAEKLKYHQVEKDGPVVIWKFDNPPKNLINAETGAELDGLVTAFENDPSLRVAVLTNQRPGVFIQHVDVATILPRAEALRAGKPPPAQTGSGMGQAIQRHGPKPIICAINGLVAGGGAVLTLHCDFRFMSRDGSIGFPEVPLGLVGPWRAVLPIVGIAYGMELLLLGKNISAERAERIGLVHRLYESKELLPETIKFAKELAKLPSLTVALTKKAIYDGAKMSDEEIAGLSRQALGSEDCYRIMSRYVAGGQNLDDLQ